MSESMIEVKVKQVIAECELHQKRIAYAVEQLQKFMPLTPERYQILTDHEVEALDQFLFRFAKMQDAIGQRFFPGILELQEEPVKMLSFLDRLNRLEQLGVIKDKEQWRTLRNIRNQLAQEYEHDVQSMSAALNHIYTSYAMLNNIFLEAKQYISSHLKS